MRTTTRNRLLAGTAAAAVGLAALGGAAAANASTPDPSSATSSSATHGHAKLTAAERTDLRQIEHALPKSFRTALRSAEHHKTRAERRDAVADVAKRAAAGDFGSTVKTIVQDATTAGTAALPKQAAARVHAIQQGRRTNLDRDVRVFLRRALDGRFGSTLQQELEQLGSGLPAVPSKSSTPSASPSASS